MRTEADELAGRLHGLRKLRGLTQNELARRSGIPKSLIANIERGGGVGVRSETFKQLATALELPQGAFEVGDLTLRLKYWYFEYARDYHVAASRNAGENVSVVAGVLAHHAVEMYLKALLLTSTTPEERKDVLRHSLGEAWTRVKSHLNLAGRTDMDVVIQGLDRFEAVRYPEEIERLGLDLYVARRGAGHLPDGRAGRYLVALDDLDRVALLAVDAAGVNPDVLRAHLSPSARPHWI